MRDSALYRDGVPREGMGPGGPAGPGRPGGGPLPPRDPAYPPPPGPGAGYAPGPRQGPGPGRHARGPGYNAAGGRRPGAPRPEPGESAGEFDGGYAKVIRASDSPVRPARRPGPGRPPGEVPADVFVYRDTEDQSADTGRRPPGPDDPSYWYDLAAAGPAEETVPVPEETRGPFEPLVSSGKVRGSVADPAAAPEGAAPAEAEPGDPVQAQARKLEQIKDLYLTAEAIGESNVDKHFDQLLAQQRELISDYFKQSPVPPGHDPGGQAEGSPGIPPPAAGGSGFPADPAESTRVTADQPRVW